MGNLARIIRLISSLFIGLLVVSFAVSNRMDVSLTLVPFPWEITLPLYFFGLLALLAGFLWGSCHSLAERYAKHLQLREDKKYIEALRSEILSLKAEKKLHDAVEASASASPASLPVEKA